MMGVTFKGVHSRQFNLFMRSDDRTVLPPSRRNDLEVPGRHGRYDFGNNKYDNRTLTIEFSFLNDTLQDLRQSVRRIAGWLSGSGELKFDDEPDKYYQAKVLDGIGLEQISTTGRFVVTFECEPFAYSHMNMVEVTKTNDEPVFVYNNGTVEAPQTITVTNLGDNTIHGFQIKIIKNR